MKYLYIRVRETIILNREINRQEVGHIVRHSVDATMKWYAIVSFLFLSTALVTATLDDEMASLEKELSDEYAAKDAQKSNDEKSIKDMSTAELISELEKEFTTDKKEVIVEKKYRQKFDDIIKKKADIERLLSQDITDLNEKKSEKLDLLDLLDEAVKDSKMQNDEKCADQRRDCASTLKPYCKSHKAKLEKICAKTCGYCKSCAQAYSAQLCASLAKSGKCTKFGYEDRMREKCPLACGYCKVEAPPKCSETTHGCCWDRGTIKANDAGTNCPRCADQYRFVCKTFKVDCMNMRDSGLFMRRMCPKECGICDGICYDNPTKKGACPFWKDTLNWCVEKPDMMKFFCPKTCNMC